MTTLVQKMEAANTKEEVAKVFQEITEASNGVMVYPSKVENAVELFFSTGEKEIDSHSVMAFTTDAAAKRYQRVVFEKDNEVIYFVCEGVVYHVPLRFDAVH